MSYIRQNIIRQFLLMINSSKISPANIFRYTVLGTHKDCPGLIENPQLPQHCSNTHIHARTHTTHARTHTTHARTYTLRRHTHTHYTRTYTLCRHTHTLHTQARALHTHAHTTRTLSHGCLNISSAEHLLLGEYRSRIETKSFASAEIESQKGEKKVYSPFLILL